MTYEKPPEDIIIPGPLEDVTAETDDERKLRMRDEKKYKEKTELNSLKNEKEVVTWIKQLRESAQSLATARDLDEAKMWGRNIDSGLERFGRVVLGLKSVDKE